LRWKRRLKLPPVISAFDAQASTYDSRFTATAIGAAMRRAVWARCAVRFAPGCRVLELNCGTGEDALWLVHRGVRVLATDVSPGMLQVAQEKLAAASGAALAQFRQLAWEDLDTFEEGPFDGVLSNFGGLNCVGDIEGAARALAAKLRPGAAVLLCVMGPVVPWEWLWFLTRADPARAFRRLRRAGTRWSGITVRYPSIAKMRRAFAPQFRVLRVSAIGSLLPPPYTEKWTGRFPRALAALDRMERRIETWWPLPALADHYLMELERR
jgi:ubiquinone/menaquinone biosynthesis C-methylase UbiE